MELIEAVVKFVLRAVLLAVIAAAGAMWLTKPWELA